MIIKSLARKTRSFAQLYDYLHRKGGEGFTVFRNFGCHTTPTRAQVLDEFHGNADHLPPRRGGNYLYHEILSTKTVAGLPVKHQRQIMLDLAETYLAQRADRLLAYGCLHEEEGHLHFHLMLSANELGQRRRYRVPKKQFATIQRNLEAYAIQFYPELQERVLYGKTERSRSMTHQEYELRKRTGSRTKKDQLRQALLAIFEKAGTQVELHTLLQQGDISLTGRGGAMVAMQGKLRCRLKTLGLKTAYERCIAPWQRTQQRQSELRTMRSKRHAREREQDSRPDHAKGE